MKNWSTYLMFDEPKISSKRMGASFYSFRDFDSTRISLTLIIDLEYFSGDDLVII